MKFSTLYISWIYTTLVLHPPDVHILSVFTILIPQFRHLLRSGHTNTIVSTHHLPLACRDCFHGNSWTVTIKVKYYHSQLMMTKTIFTISHPHTHTWYKDMKKVLQKSVLICFKRLWVWPLIIVILLLVTNVKCSSQSVSTVSHGLIRGEFSDCRELGRVCGWVQGDSSILHWWTHTSIPMCFRPPKMMPRWAPRASA